MKTFAKNLNVPQRTLTDIRDSNTYIVRKLADGNIWMTQNLAIVGPFYPDQSDSDVTWSKVTSGANQTFMLTASDSGTWCVDTSAECFNKSMVLYSENSDYGFYYNWFAATAGTGTYETASENALSSVCPKGWRLPTGGNTTGDFQNLRDNYYSSSAFGDNWTIFPLDFALSGYRRDSNTHAQNSRGAYWSSTVSDTNHTYLLYLANAGVYATSYNDFKYYGFTVRCLAK